MATTKTSSTKRKSTTTKKTVPKKKTTTKRTTTKATPAKSTASLTRQRGKSTKASSADVKSFRLQDDKQPFMSFKVTIQTLYWLILAAAILLLGIWVLNISQKVQAIYDEIDSNMTIQSDLDAKELELLRERAERRNSN